MTPSQGLFIHNLNTDMTLPMRVTPCVTLVKLNQIVQIQVDRYLSIANIYAFVLFWDGLGPSVFSQRQIWTYKTFSYD